MSSLLDIIGISPGTVEANTISNSLSSMKNDIAAMVSQSSAMSGSTTVNNVQNTKKGNNVISGNNITIKSTQQIKSTLDSTTNTNIVNSMMQKLQSQTNAQGGLILPNTSVNSNTTSTVQEYLTNNVSVSNIMSNATSNAIAVNYIQNTEDGNNIITNNVISLTNDQLISGYMTVLSDMGLDNSQSTSISALTTASSDALAGIASIFSGILSMTMILYGGAIIGGLGAIYIFKPPTIYIVIGVIIALIVGVIIFFIKHEQASASASAAAAKFYPHKELFYNNIQYFNPRYII